MTQDFQREAIEIIKDKMSEQGVTQRELARRLGRHSKYGQGWVSAALSGQRLMTFNTIAQYFWALGIKPHIWYSSLDRDGTGSGDQEES